MRLAPAVVLCALAAGSAVRAQTETAQIRDIRIPRLSRPPALAEFLDGRSRADMLRVDDFRQRSPGDNVPVSQKTAAWLGYDGQKLYAAFVCQAAPGSLRANLSRREDIFNDDVVGVILDTFHDHQRGYEFFSNPLGVQADATESETGDDDFSFDTLWYSEGRLIEGGFAALLSIPFRSLRFSSADSQTWGLALFRSIPTNNESSFWPYITRKVSGFNQQMSNASGLESISPGRNLQFIPYGAFSGAHFLDNGANPAWRSKTDVRAGLDAKAVIRDSLTLDVALNPDFSQVESDDPQVTVNQRYEVMFPEKRPFFLENSGFFQTPEILFFSRRIADPAFGARLTGKLGRWALGALAADDRAPGRGREASDPASGDRAVAGIFRAQREFGKQSNAGVLFTDREFAGTYNRVGSLDTHIRMGGNWSFDGQAMYSRTREEDGRPLGGSAFNLGLHRHSRDWGYNLGYVDRGAGFRTDLGFVTRTDIRRLTQSFSRTFRPKESALLSFGPWVSMSGDVDRRGVQQDWSVRPGFDMEFVRSTYIGASRGESFERYSGINFRRNDTQVGWHSEYFKSVTFDGGYSWGRRINYDAPEGRKPFIGDGSDFNIRITLRPSGRMKIDAIYYLSRLSTREDSFAGAPRASVFVNHLVRTRVGYQFTRELSLRAIVDYNGVLQNPSLVNLERQKRLTGDVLLTYLIHPGTALYLGYNDRVENLTLFPGEPHSVARTNKLSSTTGRQFFAKISYLFRF